MSYNPPAGPVGPPFSPGPPAPQWTDPQVPPSPLQSPDPMDEDFAAPAFAPPRHSPRAEQYAVPLPATAPPPITPEQVNGAITAAVQGRDAIIQAQNAELAHLRQTQLQSATAPRYAAPRTKTLKLAQPSCYNGKRDDNACEDWITEMCQYNRPLLLVDPDNQDYLSSCETINGVGGDIPPMIIIAGVNILEKWGHNDLAEDILLATSESGYSNDILALEWLRHFDFHSRKTQIGAKRLLIMDGFGSHMTYEFWLYAKNNDIVLFRLPAHSTHLTQPLDVGLFQPFKHYHTEAIDGAVRAGNVEFDKLDFLAAFQKIRAQTFMESTIRSAWKNTGLIPYNPQVVLSKIAAIQNSTRPVTPPYQPPVFARTPRTAKEVIAHGKKLQSTMRNLNIVDEGFQLHVDRFIKGSITSAHTRQSSERDLMATRQEAISKATRKKLSGNVAQKGGVISVKDVRQKAYQRQETELQKAEKILWRAQGKEERRQIFIDRTTARLFKAYGKQVGSKIQAHKAWKEQQLVLW